MNETDPVALAREALETYKVDEWPTMCALAQAVLDKDAVLTKEENAHIGTIKTRDYFEEQINTIATTLGMSEYDCEWSNLNDVSENCITTAAELKQKIELQDARIKDLEATLAEAAGSLFSYDQSYGGGGGQEECLEIARLLGYKDDAMPDEYLLWLRIKYTDARAALEGKNPE